MVSSIYLKFVVLLVLLASPVAFAQETPEAPVADEPPTEPPVIAPTPVLVPPTPVEEPTVPPTEEPPVVSPVPVPVDVPTEVPVPIEIPTVEPVPEVVPVDAPVIVADVHPVGHCWEITDPNVSTQVVSVYFGYLNNGAEVDIPAGESNNISGTSSLVPVVTHFRAGRNSFSLGVTATIGEVLVWELEDKTATVNTGLEEHTCSRSSGPITVTLSYDGAIPDPQDVLTTPLADRVAAVSGYDKNDFNLTLTVGAKRDPFAVNAAISKDSASGTPQISAVAALVSASPASLTAAGYTPLSISSQDTSMDIPPVVTPITPPTPSGLSDGGIAGIVIGAVAGALILAIIIYIIVSNMTGSNRSTTAASASAAASSRASTARAAVAVNPAAADESSEEDSEEEDSEDEVSSSDEEDSEEEDSEQESSEQEESSEEEESSSEESS